MRNPNCSRSPMCFTLIFFNINQETTFFIFSPCDPQLFLWPFLKVTPINRSLSQGMCISFDLQLCFPTAGYISARLTGSPGATMAHRIANHTQSSVYLRQIVEVDPKPGGTDDAVLIRPSLSQSRGTSALPPEQPCDIATKRHSARFKTSSSIFLLIKFHSQGSAAQWAMSTVTGPCWSD